jgi:hypothetical protein
MVLVGLLAWRRNAIGLAAIVGVVLIWFVVNMTAFSHHIWLSAALPMAAAVPPAILFGAAQLWLGRHRAEYFASQSELLQRVQAPGMGVAGEAWRLPPGTCPARRRHHIHRPVRLPDCAARWGRAHTRTLEQFMRWWTKK